MNNKFEIGGLLKGRKVLAFSIISISEVEEKIGKSEFYTLDCTSRKSYMMCHIPGAQFIGSIYSVAELPPNKESSLVFYSRNSKCRAATNSAKRAREAGYKNTFIMRAGIAGWLFLNKPTIGRRGSSLCVSSSSSTVSSPGMRARS